MRYRSRAEIISDILTVARGGGISRTKVMYKSMLSFLQLKEYLSILTERGLLRYDKTTQTYGTTEKGLIFLHKYAELTELTKGIEQGRVTNRRIVSQEVN
jgi:predicted transcriptional regulator